MNLIKVKDYEEMSQKSCKMFVEVLKNIDQPVFGLATGSTPIGMYERLVKLHKEGEISFKDVTTFNLDEYIGLPADHPQSYHYFMEDILFKHVDISSENTHLPNGVAEDLEQECKDFEKLIEEAGGIDLQILGIGENGHIAFNEPGSKFDGKTAIVDLAQATLEANSRFFDSIEDVPTQAITMGIGTIMKADKIILLASGSSKAEAMKQVVNGPVTEDVPATILQRHPNVTIIADEEALSDL